MQRTALTVLASAVILSTLTGCSLFGKKKDPVTDLYDPVLDSMAATTMTDRYPLLRSAALYQPATPVETYADLATTTEPLAATSGSQYHTVSKKDTLYAIARMYYNGDHRRWKDIYEANRANISDPNKIRVGQRLLIP